jgi:glucose-1-phosphate thymidylyltransferase
MKGIILAGGSGTRLHPLTKIISKQLLPVYDKPMVYYPLSTLMLGGIREILIISTPHDIKHFERLFGNGNHLGLKISYAIQENPGGIAQAFIIGEEFIGNDNVALILGDNIFHGYNLTGILEKAKKENVGATIFAYYVNDPERYGVVKFDENKNAITIEEKPQNPQSNWAVTGLYIYDNNVINIAKNLQPSVRGELEITDINNAYLKANKLKVNLLGRGHSWLDTGTHKSLIDSSIFIKTIEDRQGLKIGCVEEIAYLKGYVNEYQLNELAKNNQADYAKYLRSLINEQK